MCDLPPITLCCEYSPSHDTAICWPTYLAPAMFTHKYLHYIDHNVYEYHEYSWVPNATVFIATMCPISSCVLHKGLWSCVVIVAHGVHVLKPCRAVPVHGGVCRIAVIWPSLLGLPLIKVTPVQCTCTWTSAPSSGSLLVWGISRLVQVLIQRMLDLQRKVTLLLLN